jgi:hypothetical protein
MRAFGGVSATGECAPRCHALTPRPRLWGRLVLHDGSRCAKGCAPLDVLLE